MTRTISEMEMRAQPMPFRAFAKEHFCVLLIFVNPKDYTQKNILVSFHYCQKRILQSSNSNNIDGLDSMLPKKAGTIPISKPLLIRDPT